MTSSTCSLFALLPFPLSPLAPVQASVFVGTSVDGFIARPGGELDWLPDSPEDHGYQAFFDSVDALVIGRHTYETVLGFGGWVYGSKAVYVLSSSRLQPAPAGAIVHHLSGEPADIVARLVADGVQHAYVDGGLTVQRFLRAGLIQRLIVTRVPILIGEGIPLFGITGRDILLRHIETRTFPSGLVQSEYEVVAANPA